MTESGWLTQLLACKVTFPKCMRKYVSGNRCSYVRGDHLLENKMNLNFSGEVVQFLQSLLAIALKEQPSLRRSAIMFLSSKFKCFAIAVPVFLPGKQQDTIAQFYIVTVTVLISYSNCNVWV